jgi:hypothetical protein
MMPQSESRSAQAVYDDYCWTVKRKGSFIPSPQGRGLLAQKGKTVSSRPEGFGSSAWYDGPRLLQRSLLCWIYRLKLAPCAGDISAV